MDIQNIARSSDGTIYIVYENKLPVGGSGGSKPINQLDFFDEPRVTTFATTVFVAFAVSEQFEPSEIMLYTNNQQDPAALQYISDINGATKRQPRMVAQGITLAIAWRELGQPLTPARGLQCLGNVSSWDSQSQDIRAYDVPPENHCYNQIDLAACGGIFAGVWDHAHPEAAERIIPWTSYTSEAALIPLVRR